MKKAVWGWLYPLRNGFTPLELKKDEYTIGKDPGCSYVIKDTQLSKQDYSTLSKKQFRIIHKKDGVYLEGIKATYINNRKIGEGEKSILNHNDRIAIAKLHIKVFVFLQKTQEDMAASQLPEEISNKYFISFKLGQGGFGEVSLLLDKETGSRYALKTVKKNPNIKKYVYTEARIVKTVNHPCIISTMDVIDKFSVLFIVMEHMEGGSLQDCLRLHKSLTESDMKLVFFQLVNAIQYLHELKVVHRDIKPENVLMSSYSPSTLVKVSDFGISKILDPNTVMDTNVGTPFYKAPEIQNNWVTEYTNKVDVWSLGILLYYCLSGNYPFPKWNDVTTCVLSFPSNKWRLVSDTAITLVNSMLQVDPIKRASVDNILSHAWLRDERMRHKAHQLMCPDIPYPELKPPTPANRVLEAVKKSNSVREPAAVKPRGMLQYMNLRDKPSLQSKINPAELPPPRPSRNPVASPLNKPLSSPFSKPLTSDRKPAQVSPVKPFKSPVASPLNKPSASPFNVPPVNRKPLQQPPAKAFGSPVASPLNKPSASPFNVPPVNRKPLEPSPAKPFESPVASPLNIPSASPFNILPVNRKPLHLSPVNPFKSPVASPLNKPSSSPLNVTPVNRKPLQQPPAKAFRSPVASPLNKPSASPFNAPPVNRKPVQLSPAKPSPLSKPLASPPENVYPS